MARIATIEFLYALIVTSVLFAKLLHLYCYRDAIPTKAFVVWGPTFFCQDILFITLVWLVLSYDGPSKVRLVAVGLICLLSFVLGLMVISNFSFFLVTNSEIRWHLLSQFDFGLAGLETLWSGFRGCIPPAIAIYALSYIGTPHFFRAVGYLLSPVLAAIGITCPKTETSAVFWSKELETDRPHASRDGYAILPTEERAIKVDVPRCIGIRKRAAILLALAAVVLLRVLRPSEPSYLFLSWTLPLTPFAPLARRTDIVVNHGLNRTTFLTTDQTSLTVPPVFSWLPKTTLAGFEDWYEGSDGQHNLHYSPEQDPLYVGNSQVDIVHSLKTVLKSSDMKIKHVIVTVLESGRRDTFPLDPKSIFWQRIARSFSDGVIPNATLTALERLTSTSRYLTAGGTQDSRHEALTRRRGAIQAINATSPASYTLKSLVSILCGATPVIADFNQAYNHQIYQPCLPHILEAMNSNLDAAKAGKRLADRPWKSVYMQSSTDTYDHQEGLTRAMGFNTSITERTIIDPKSPHYPPAIPRVNYYGPPDKELKPYFEDVLDDVAKSGERLFMTHLTATTHHPWNIPKTSKYQKLFGTGNTPWKVKTEKYLNTIGYVDEWLADMLDILEAKGIANETLMVFVGDHGNSLPENGGGVPIDRNHVNGFRVPLLFSHPHLPRLTIESAVTSQSILPTVLDLLSSTSSLSPQSQTITSDLLRLYEGQSLIRPVQEETKGGRPRWQFAVTNTGGSRLIVQASTIPWRLVVPLVTEVKWQFSDLDIDPQEEGPGVLTSMILKELVAMVEERYGVEGVDWVADVVEASQWFVADNKRRWRYSS